MIVDKGDGITWPVLQHGVLEDRSQVVSSTSFACLVEVVVQRDVKEG